MHLSDFCLEYLSVNFLSICARFEKAPNFLNPTVTFEHERQV